MKKNDFKSNFEIINEYVEFLKNTYNAVGFPDKLMVSQHQQWHEIEKLGNSVRNENCFLITNLLDFSIIFAKNMELLGLNSMNIEKPQFLSLASSEGFLQITMLYNKTLIELCILEPQHLRFLKPQFIYQIPITKPNGEIVLIKKTMSPFQYTSSGKMISNVSEFTVIKENYNNEPLEPRFMDFPEHLNKSFKEIIYKKFNAEYSPFSPKELIIMKAYYQNPELNLTQLATELNITVETLKSYNKTIITKAKDYMGPLFSIKNAKDISVFFERCGVI